MRHELLTIAFLGITFTTSLPAQTKTAPSPAVSA